MVRKEKVTRVLDGDTFETASRKNPVRLACRCNDKYAKTLP